MVQVVPTGTPFNISSTMPTTLLATSPGTTSGFSLPSFDINNIAGSLFSSAGANAGAKIGGGIFGKTPESTLGTTIGSTIGSAFGIPGQFIGGFLGGMLDAIGGGDGKKRIAAAFTTGTNTVPGGVSYTGKSGLKFTTYNKRTSQDAADSITKQAMAIDSLLTDLAKSKGINVDLSGVTLTGHGQAGAQDKEGPFFGLTEYSNADDLERKIPDLIPNEQGKFVEQWIKAAGIEKGTIPMMDAMVHFGGDFWTDRSRLWNGVDQTPEAFAAMGKLSAEQWESLYDSKGGRSIYMSPEVKALQKPIAPEKLAGAAKSYASKKKFGFGVGDESVIKKAIDIGGALNPMSLRDVLPTSAGGTIDDATFNSTNPQTNQFFTETATAATTSPASVKPNVNEISTGDTAMAGFLGNLGGSILSGIGDFGSSIMSGIGDIFTGSNNTSWGGWLGDSIDLLGQGIGDIFTGSNNTSVGGFLGDLLYGGGSTSTGGSTGGATGGTPGINPNAPSPTGTNGQTSGSGGLLDILFGGSGGSGGLLGGLLGTGGTAGGTGGGTSSGGLLQTLLSGYVANRGSKRSQSEFEDLLKLGAQTADPFKNYRGMFADRLVDMYTNPQTFIGDPGYQFRFNEGMRAMNRANAAGGFLHSGRALAEASRYGQDMASQELDKEISRLGVLSGASSGQMGTAGNLFAQGGADIANIINQRYTGAGYLLS